MYRLTARKPEEVKRQILQDAKYHGAGVESFHRGAITGWLNKYLGGDDNRHIVIRWLFGSGIQTSRELTNQQWYGLHCWMEPHKNETGIWEVGPLFSAESLMVLGEAIKWNAMTKNATGDVIEHMVSEMGYKITAIDDEVPAAPVVVVKKSIVKNIF